MRFPAATRHHDLAAGRALRKDAICIPNLPEFRHNFATNLPTRSQFQAMTRKRGNFEGKLSPLCINF
jgi:hypothetical protein